MNRARIVVLGSINMDLVVSCEHLVSPGETVIANACAEVCGGKGANQAVAAARLGSATTMIGKVGDDAFGSTLVENLRRAKVDVTHVRKQASCSSGLAVVAVEASGENSIMVVPGANGTITPEEVPDLADTIGAADVLLLQLEIPIDTVQAARSLAQQAGTRVILDPAPAPNPFPQDLLNADLVCPNESEAAIILGQPIDSIDSAKQAAWELTRRGAANAMITLGDKGAVLCDGKRAQWIKTPTVEPVDSTAAGDALAAAMAVRWGAGCPLFKAAEFACAAGAAATQRAGAQAGLPTWSEVEELIVTRGIE